MSAAVSRLALTNDERAAVATLVEEVSSSGSTWDPLATAAAAAEQAQRLPLRLRQFLCGARQNESDLTVVSNLPVDPELPATPAGWDHAAKTGAGQREELTLLLVGSAMAEPFGWENQQDGRVVHDVCPVPGQETSMTSASSETELSLHTEDVYHRCRSDYVSLYCLRNPDSVGTTVVSVTNLDFPADLRRLLRQPKFRFYADDSHAVRVPTNTGPENYLGGRPYELGSVLFGPEERPYLRFDIDFMSVATDAGAEYLDAIKQTQRMFRGAQDRVVLRPGDAVFVDNYRVVHGRDPFIPRYDGKDRWLKRLNLIRDVRRIYSGAERRSRIIT